MKDFIFKCTLAEAEDTLRRGIEMLGENLDGHEQSEDVYELAAAVKIPSLGLELRYADVRHDEENELLFSCYCEGSSQPFSFTDEDVFTFVNRYVAENGLNAAPDDLKCTVELHSFTDMECGNEYMVMSFERSALCKVFCVNHSDKTISSDKDIFDIVNGPAYRDMQPRHFTGIGAKRKEREDVFRDLSDKICEYFKEEVKDEKGFDEWHNKTCKELMKSFTEKTGIEMHYGKAQKLVNMTFKHLYCFGDADKYKEKFEHCHMPLDSYILKWGANAKNIELEKYKNWSYLDENEYKEIQRKFRKGLAKNKRFEGVAPFFAEFYIWEEAKTGVRRMKVTIHSRESVERLIAQSKFPKNTAVISFYDPAIKRIDKNYTHVDYSGVCDEKNVHFSELEDLDIDVLGERGCPPESYFSDESVSNMAKCIMKAYDDDMEIICQCEYGQSRKNRQALDDLKRLPTMRIDSDLKPLADREFLTRPKLGCRGRVLYLEVGEGYRYRAAALSCVEYRRVLSAACAHRRP